MWMIAHMDDMALLRGESEKVGDKLGILGESVRITEESGSSCGPGKLAQLAD